MGWLWSSSSPTQKNAPPAPRPTQESSVAPQSTTSSKILTRDELAEEELNAFLQEIETDTRPSSTKYTRVPRQPPPSSTSTGSYDPLSDQLLPKTMSCRDAFDAAFYCNSLGGQFNNLYRYGTVKSCSENWNNFWFCMRTRSYGAKEKEEAIRNRYRETERIKYARDEVGKSSEDVWRSREKKIPWGEAFNVPYPEFDGDDEAWNRMEKARRSGKVDGSMGP